MKIRKRDLRKLSKLSPQQRKVVSLMCDGETYKGIAYTLNISEKTVSYYASNAYMKTGIHGIANLVKFALRVGLTTLCLVVGVQAQPAPLATPNSTVVLGFYYPTNDMANATVQMQTVLTNPATWPALTNFTFRYYSATNLNGPSTQWKLVATQVNAPTVTNNGVVFVASPPLPIYGSQTFYTATTSNSWGTSFFSSLAATALPPNPQQSLSLNSVNP